MKVITIRRRAGGTYQIEFGDGHVYTTAETYEAAELYASSAKASFEGLNDTAIIVFSDPHEELVLRYERYAEHCRANAGRQPLPFEGYCFLIAHE